MLNIKTPFQQLMYDKVVGIGKSDISNDEKFVLRLLLQQWQNGVRRTTNRYIADQIPELMSGQPVSADDSVDSSTFAAIKVIIRKLRYERLAPIFSDTNGYWIPMDEKDVTDTMIELERSSARKIKKIMDEYEIMKNVFNVSSKYFESMSTTALPDTPDKITVGNEMINGKVYELYVVSGIGVKCTCPEFLSHGHCKHADKYTEDLSYTQV